MVQHPLPTINPKLYMYFLGNLTTKATRILRTKAKILLLRLTLLHHNHQPSSKSQPPPRLCPAAVLSPQSSAFSIDFATGRGVTLYQCWGRNEREQSVAEENVGGFQVSSRVMFSLAAESCLHGCGEVLSSDCRFSSPSWAGLFAAGTPQVCLHPFLVAGVDEELLGMQRLRLVGKFVCSKPYRPRIGVLGVSARICRASYLKFKLKTLKCLVEVQELLDVFSFPFFTENGNIGCFVGCGEPLNRWLQEPYVERMHLL
ncbi:hypothetical protein Droror1_Dr00000554 [Drosera rotundifolia]